MDAVRLWVTLNASVLQTEQARIALAWIEVICAWLIGFGCHRLERQAPPRPLARLLWRSTLSLLNVIGLLSLLIGSVGLYFLL